MVFFWCFVKLNIESGELLFFSVRLILKGSLDVHDSLSAVHLCAPLTSGEARIYLKKKQECGVPVDFGRRIYTSV